MKPLILKSIYFLLLIFVIGAALTPLLPENKYWGNKEYASKLNEYKKDKYNTVLFGTSHIYRGINPLAFDSLVNQHNPSGDTDGEEADEVVITSKFTNILIKFAL